MRRRQPPSGRCSTRSSCVPGAARHACVTRAPASGGRSCASSPARRICRTSRPDAPLPDAVAAGKRAVPGGRRDGRRASVASCRRCCRSGSRRCPCRQRREDEGEPGNQRSPPLKCCQVRQGDRRTGLPELGKDLLPATRLLPEVAEVIAPAARCRSPRSEAVQQFRPGDIRLTVTDTAGHASRAVRRRPEQVTDEPRLRREQPEQHYDGLELTRSLLVAEEHRGRTQVAAGPERPVQVENPLRLAWRLHQWRQGTELIHLQGRKRPWLGPVTTFYPIDVRADLYRYVGGDPGTGWTSRLHAGQLSFMPHRGFGGRHRSATRPHRSRERAVHARTPSPGRVR